MYNTDRTLVIIDYGMGNLHSVRSAFNYLGASPIVTGDPAEVAAADTLVLPGVGSFYKAMHRLEERGLAAAIQRSVAERGRKILGICLGLQLMAEYGEEDGGRAGLGLIQGGVKRFGQTPSHKIPHIGFNQVQFTPGSKLFASFDQEVDCYFVHSYRLEVQKRPGFTAVCHYISDFVGAYEHENVFGTQFHPEKSQTNGLKILANFLRV